MKRLFSASVLWTIAWWVFAWSRIPIVSEYSFFPLWLGYIFTLNAAAELLYRDSLMRRMRGWFVLLFIISIPLWWFFERINSYLQNWHYVLLHPISQMHYVIQASIDFSTVVPAVLSTTFLFFRFFETQRIGTWHPVPIHRSWLLVSMAVGVASFYFMQVFPDQTFPLAWIAPFLILEPVLYISNQPSLLGEIQKGDWTLTCSVMIATLFTGFFWEMWNYHSLPKWYYTVPYVGFLKIFEMPILGYGGYPFFGIVVLSYSIAVFALAKRNYEAYINSPLSYTTFVVANNDDPCLPGQRPVPSRQACARVAGSAGPQDQAALHPGLLSASEPHRAAVGRDAQACDA